MLDPTQLLHAYDLRGQIGVDLAEDDFHRLGRTLAAHMHRQGRKTLVMAHDGRTSSPMLTRALRTGVLAGGVDVLDLGLTSTPVAYFAEAALGADGVAMITASHNPATWNGLKLVLGGEVVHGPALAALVQAAQAPLQADGPAGQLRTVDVLPAYLAQLALTPPLARPLRVALDGMHGVAGPLALKVLQALGAEVVALRCSVDGRFPEGPPDPSQADHLRLLAQTVVGLGLDLGLALDGDGDRLVVVDGRGEMIAPDRLLVLFAQKLLHQHPGGLILMDIKTSDVCRRAIAGAGGKVKLIPSGHAHMRAAMRKDQALLGGEFSGHLFFADLGFDDGLMAAVRLLRLLADEPRSPSAVFDTLPHAYATPELLLPRPPALNLTALYEELTLRLPRPGERLYRLDGLRLESAEGFILVRASHTQPLLSLRLEGRDQDALSRLKSRLIEAWPIWAPPLPNLLA